MSNKKRRHQRMERIPTGSRSGVTPMYATVPGTALAQRVERISEYALRTSDGALILETSKLGAPQDVYDADVAWLERRSSYVSLYFGKASTEGELSTRVEVKLSFEAFIHHLWENSSKEFFGRLKEWSDKRRGAGAEAKPEPLEKYRVCVPAKQHSIWANFTVFAHAGSEASLDFFHLSPNAIAAFVRTKDGSSIVVTPKLRVLTTTQELLRLLHLAEEIVPELEKVVMNEVKHE
jgi:hypothetical protein